MPHNKTRVQKDQKPPLRVAYLWIGNKIPVFLIAEKGINIQWKTLLSFKEHEHTKPIHSREDRKQTSNQGHVLYKTQSIDWPTKGASISNSRNQNLQFQRGGNQCGNRLEQAHPVGFRGHDVRDVATIFLL